MQAMTKARRDEEQEESTFWDWVDAGMDWLELVVEVGPSAVANVVTEAAALVGEAVGVVFEALGPIFEVLGCILGGLG